MGRQKALEQLENIHRSILERYPNRQSLTNEIFEIIIEMLSVDYESISPGGKRVHVFNEYMLSLLKKALENNGSKNYMMDLINVFMNATISQYLYKSFSNKSDDLMSIFSVRISIYNQLPTSSAKFNDTRTIVKQSSDFTHYCG